MLHSIGGLGESESHIRRWWGKIIDVIGMMSCRRSGRKIFRPIAL